MGLSKYATMTKIVKNIKDVAKVKNYNLNVTEVLDSEMKNAFPGKTRPYSFVY